MKAGGERKRCPPTGYNHTIQLLLLLSLLETEWHANCMMMLCKSYYRGGRESVFTSVIVATNRVWRYRLGTTTRQAKCGSPLYSHKANVSTTSRREGGTVLWVPTKIIVHLHYFDGYKSLQISSRLHLRPTNEVGKLGKKGLKYRQKSLGLFIDLRTTLIRDSLKFSKVRAHEAANREACVQRATDVCSRYSPSCVI